MTPAETRCVMTQIVMPMHTNGVAGVMFGGIMMEWIDVCAGVAAMRHAAGAVLTASIDRLDFLSPVQVGEIVVLQAMVNYVARTSMEVGCRVETEDMRTRIRRNVTKAYLTFVAVDERGRPRPLSPLSLETDEDRRRHGEAAARRHLRLRAAGRPEVHDSHDANLGQPHGGHPR
jgi:acyl-CoA hydrolase